jgi:hypothetical protein
MNRCAHVLPALGALADLVRMPYADHMLVGLPDGLSLSWSIIEGAIGMAARQIG